MKKPALFGKYVLLERLNVGGMAEVFAAKSFGVEGFERLLAIKKILPTMAEDQEFITMFIDEARISAQLSHANIVYIHDFGRHEDAYFLAMEYVSGKDLRVILERFRRRKELVPTAMAVFIATRICEGLDYAHRKKDVRGEPLGIIHRDVSPQNILLSYEGEVKLIDFGIAKAANRQQRTMAGVLKGKFAYMSPEQVRGQDIDRRSDLFAVGVILYELLTGEKLFVGESDYSTLEKVRKAEVVSPRQLNPDLPLGLERVVLRALAREPADRYQWASELQEDLMRFLLAGDAIYSARQLAGFMKEAFAVDLEEESAKLARFAAQDRPVEGTGTTSSSWPAAAPPPRGSVNPSSGEGAVAVGPQRQAPAAARNPPPGPLDAGDRTLVVAGGLALPPITTPPHGPSYDSLGPTLPRLRASGEAPPSLAPAGSADHRRTLVTGFSPVLEPEEGTLPPGPPPGEPTTLGASPFGEGAAGPSPLAREPTQVLEGRLPRRPPPAGAAPADRPRRPGRDSTEVQPGPGAARRPGGEPPAPDASPTAPVGAPPEAGGRARRGRRGLLLAIAGASALALGALGAVAVRLSEGARSGVIPTAAPRLRFSATVSPGGLTFTEASRQVDLEPGEYVIEARPAEPGHAAARVPVSVKAGAYVSLPLEFQADPPPPPPPVEPAPPPPLTAWSAVIVSTEPGVEILIDGRRVGATPRVEVNGLAIDTTHAGQARKAGFEPLAFTLENPGRRPTVEVPLTLSHRARAAASARKAVGKLLCATTPPGAEVLIDGRSTGRLTPLSRRQAIELPLGMHTVAFRLDGRLSPLQPFTLGEEHRDTPLVIKTTLR